MRISDWSSDVCSSDLADSIGTGNKRIRLSVSSLRTSLRAFKRAIIGPSALASGYWTTTTSWAPNSAEQCSKVPLEQSAAAGHLLVRAENGSPGRPEERSVGQSGVS